VIANNFNQQLIYETKAIVKNVGQQRARNAAVVKPNSLIYADKANKVHK
jgi:hypothetical protein